MQNFMKFLGVIALSMLLSGCPGGGGGAVPPPAPPASDATPPVISLVGPATVTVEAGTPYVDLGATALDNVDGNITANIAAVCNVNTAVVGIYSCTYDVSDSSSNPATQVTRVVNVVDTTGPGITVPGSNPDSVLVGSVYTPPTATAIDTVDGVRSVSMSGSVNTVVVGSYTLTYTSTDSHGNTSSVNLVVNVIPVPDTTPPVITLVGADPQTVYVGDAFVDLGATALDNVDGNITANIAAVCNVNTAVVGIYSCTYDVSDSSSNPATQVTRVVNVVALPTLATGKVLYYGSDPAQVAIYGGDGAVYSYDLATSTATRLAGGYVCISLGCGVVYPQMIVPAQTGLKVVLGGSNLNGIHILDLTTNAVNQVVYPVYMDTVCADNAEENFDITSNASAMVFSSRCFPNYPTNYTGEYRDIFFMKLDGTHQFIRITNDTVRDVAPVVGATNPATGYTSIYFISEKSGGTGVWKQEVDLVAGVTVGSQSLVVSNVETVYYGTHFMHRGLSMSPDYTKLAFVRKVGGVNHIFVKNLTSGTETDLTQGENPAWVIDGSNKIFYIGSSGARMAISPDGTGKMQLPTLPFIANGGVGTNGSIVAAPAGY